MSLSVRQDMRDFHESHPKERRKPVLSTVDLIRVQEYLGTNHMQIQKQRVIQASGCYDKRLRFFSRAAGRFASLKWAINLRSDPHSSVVCFYTGNVSLLRFDPISNPNKDFGSRGDDFQ